MGKVGRPTKFTPENCKIILEAVSLGAPHQLAPMAAGVAYHTFREWIVEGENDPESKFADFANEVKIAEGKAVKRWLKIIDDAAADKNWAAAAWKLERRYPQHFGRFDRPETHPQQVHVEVKVDVSALPTEDLEGYRALLARLSERTRGGNPQGGNGVVSALAN